MDLNAITVDDFKAFFRRDFPYLPEFSPTQLYNEGDRVYHTPTALFYDCLVNGTQNVLPTVGASWAIAADNIDNYILDADIEKAYSEARIAFNTSLFSSEENLRIGFYYLAANYLVNDIRAAGSGLAGRGVFSVTSRSVGNVSESYGIPKAYLDNPIYQFYTQSPYGLKYLSLVLPLLVGNIGTVAGATNP